MNLHHWSGTLRARVGRILLLAMTAVAVASCATPKADPAKLANIHEIVLTGFAEPPYKRMDGLTVEEPSLFGSNETFAQQMAKQGLHLGADAKAAVATELTKAGYTVAPEKSATTDALLDVNIGAAIYAVYPIILGGVCKPAAFFDVRLTDARSGATLYSATYSYQDTANTGVTGHIALVSDVKYNFDDRNALYANPKLAAEGLDAAAPALAAALARDLAKH